MSDIKKFSLTEEEVSQLVINYAPFYLSAFNTPIKSYSEREGKVLTRELSVKDLNSGVISKETTDFLRTKAEYITDNFLKYLEFTVFEKSDFEDADKMNIISQILTKYNILNENRFFNGDGGINHGLIRTDLATSTDFYYIGSISMPSTLADAIVDLKDSLKLSNDSGNGLKKLIPLGRYDTFLSSENNGGSTYLNEIKEVLKNIEFVDTTNIKNLPDIDGYVLFNPNTNEIQQTGNGASVHKTIETLTSENIGFKNGSLNVRQTAPNSVIFKSR
ncbi:MAG: hypothetical protein Ta2D_05440 [Rickettsiales bacterium]|nr:MAG: hypothetical protein Ta2D_05440 [Rickettsiales bacterium]